VRQDRVSLLVQFLQMLGAHRDVLLWAQRIDCSCAEVNPGMRKFPHLLVRPEIKDRRWNEEDRLDTHRIQNLLCRGVGGKQSVVKGPQKRPGDDRLRRRFVVVTKELRRVD